jgi:hypothetical protein
MTDGIVGRLLLLCVWETNFLCRLIVTQQELGRQRNIISIRKMLMSRTTNLKQLLQKISKTFFLYRTKISIGAKLLVMYVHYKEDYKINNFRHKNTLISV